MSKIKDFVGLIIPQYIPLALFGAFLGIVVTTHALPDYRFLVLAIILSSIVSAFNAFNAIVDREIDKINKPHRPLVSNKFTENQVILFTIGFYALAILLSLTLSFETLVVTIIAVIITFLYSYKPIYTKKRFILGNFSGALLYAFLCPLMGWSLYTSYPLNFTIFFFLFILGIGLSFVKDFEDSFGDGIHKIKSLPVVIGKTGAVNLVIMVEIFAFSVIAYAIFSGQLGLSYILLFILIIPFIFYTNKFRYVTNLVNDQQIFNKIILLILISETIIIILNLI
jgi:4-hydroxybenzoate polyprenyltransferase